MPPAVNRTRLPTRYGRPPPRAYLASMSPRDRRPSDPRDPDRPRAHRPAPARPAPERETGDEPEPAAARAPAVVVPPPPTRARTPLETVLLASTAALLAAVAWPIATGESRPEIVSSHAAVPSFPATPVTPTTAVPPVASAPAIQIALLLDTSSSMDGLIDQARSQLWSVVNALDSATLHGQRPTLEIALYEYGNSELSPAGGFIRQVSPFTTELDRVSQALFELDTMGGSEHAGQVIARSLDELAWREGGLRVVFLAGNEELDQGPVGWRDAIARARSRGIVVNAVNCTAGGSPDPGWVDAATLAGGRFLQIDHDAVAVHVAAPQDAEIARLGEALNATYVGYGRDGAWGLENQVAQDDNAEGIGMGSSVQRALTKGSSRYANPSWDLVDAVDSAAVSLDELDAEQLPAEARGLAGAELHTWIDGKRKEREALKSRLAALAKARAAHVAAQAAADASGAARLDTAIVDSILSQARDAGFTIEPAA